jgi:DNA-binding winged helix-turn-helix (wHTH) protein/Tol biopolymer transport system component
VSSSAQPPSVIRFAAFELDAASGQLRKGGVALKIHPQPFRVLQFLADRAGQVVTREEIRHCLWGDNTFVDFERGINFCVNQIRAVLGDDAERPRYIETLPRRGYRLIVPVTGNGSSTPGITVISRPMPMIDAAGVQSPKSGDTTSFPESKLPASRTASALWYTTVAAAIALAAVAFRLYAPAHTKRSSELTFRQLTVNSVENPVSSGAISPDGKYVAYADINGVNLRLIEIGEMRTITQHESPNGDNVDWEIPAGAWFPDSSRFLANAREAGIEPGRTSSESCTIWLFSVLGGPPTKLRDNSAAWSVSPDGSSISFTSKSGRLGDHEIWLMGPTGDQARLLFPTGDDSSISRVQWSPNGQRVLYRRTYESGSSLESRDLHGDRATTILPPSLMTNVGDFLWLPDGRFLYAVGQQQSLGETYNYWAMRLDETGRSVEVPRQVTHLDAESLNRISVTKDGKRAAFQRASSHAAIYLAEVESGGTRIHDQRRFTAEDVEEAISDWTADSKTVVIVLNLGDHYELYRQSLDHGSRVPIATSAPGSLLEAAQLSPDGNWVILQVYSISSGPNGPTPLMRVPLSGGSAELIFPVAAGSGFTCARSPSDLCALAEPSADRRQLIATTFDPVKGERGRELARLDLKSPKDSYWPLFGLSPDGSHLAISRSPAGPIEILSLQGLPTQIIDSKDLTQMKLLGFAADQKGLLVINGVRDGTALVHVDLHGNVQTLWRCRGGQRCDFTPSPDGRHLAILDRQLSANLWMMESF